MTARALVEIKRNARIALAYEDQAGAGTRVEEVSLDGPIETGDVFNLEFTLPPVVLGEGAARRGTRLGWMIQAVIPGWSGPEDALALDVKSNRTPDRTLPAVELVRSLSTFALFGRGKKTKNWDVSVHLATPEVARGDSAQFNVSIDSPAPDRVIQVGVICTEHWFSRSGSDDVSGSGNMAVVAEHFVDVDASAGGGQTVSVEIPADEPFSWHRENEQAILQRKAGFTWLAFAREGKPKKGPEKEAELTVVP